MYRFCRYVYFTFIDGLKIKIYRQKNFSVVKVQQVSWKFFSHKTCFSTKTRTNSQRFFNIKDMYFVFGFNFTSWAVFIFWLTFYGFSTILLGPIPSFFFLLTLLTFNEYFFLFKMKNHQNQKLCCILNNFSFRLVKRFMIQRITKTKNLYFTKLSFSISSSANQPITQCYCKCYLLCNMKSRQMQALNIYKKWLSYFTLSQTTIIKHLNPIIISPARFWIFE